MVIQPSIDAFSPKNQDMDDATAQAILGHVGLLGAGVPQNATATFTRYDGSPGRVDRRCDIITTGPPPGADTPLVTQVSRWDRLKDPVGVMLGFAEHAYDGTEAHLVLAGPNVSGVTDDPKVPQSSTRSPRPGARCHTSGAPKPNSTTSRTACTHPFEIRRARRLVLPGLTDP